MRAGVHTKACGVAVIASMAVCFFLPVSLVTVVPSCFFGSVLCFIAVELIFEWLIESKERCTRAEYFVVWVTFIAINLFGVEAGMGIGIIRDSGGCLVWLPRRILDHFLLATGLWLPET